MTISRSANTARSSKKNPYQMVLLIREYDNMSSGEIDHTPGRNNTRQRQGDSHRLQVQRSTSRRSSMAIPDLLNPVSLEQSLRPHNNGPSQGEVTEPTADDCYAQHNNRPGSSSSASSSEGMSLTSSLSLASSRSSVAPNEGRRQFRPTYLEEEVYFIWYHRIDLGYDWQDINDAYNAQFPDRRREGFGGIQCKYYRYCEEFGIPKVRQRNRAAPQVREYGMRSRTGLYYPWMRQ